MFGIVYDESETFYSVAPFLVFCRTGSRTLPSLGIEPTTCGYHNACTEHTHHCMYRTYARLRNCIINKGNGVCSSKKVKQDFWADLFCSPTSLYSVKAISQLSDPRGLYKYIYVYIYVYKPLVCSKWPDLSRYESDWSDYKHQTHLLHIIWTNSIKKIIKVSEYLEKYSKL